MDGIGECNCGAPPPGDPAWMPTLYYEGVCNFAGRPGFNMGFFTRTEQYKAAFNEWYGDWFAEYGAQFGGVNSIKYCVWETDVPGSVQFLPVSYQGTTYSDRGMPPALVYLGTFEAAHSFWKQTWWASDFATYWNNFVQLRAQAFNVIAPPATIDDIPEFNPNCTSDCDVNGTKTGPLAALQTHYLHQVVTFEFFHMADGTPTGEWATLEMTWNKWTNEVSENSSFSQSMLTYFTALKEQFPLRDDVPDTIIPTGGSPGDWMPWDLPLSRDPNTGDRIPSGSWHIFFLPPLNEGEMDVTTVILSETELVAEDCYMLLGVGSRGPSDILQVRCRMTITLSDPFTPFEFRQLVAPLRTAVHTIKPVLQTDPSSGTLMFNNAGGIVMASQVTLWTRSTNSIAWAGIFSDWHGEAPPPANGFVRQMPACDCYGFVWGGHPHCLSAIRPFWDANVIASLWGDGFITARYFVSRWYIKTADVDNGGNNPVWFKKDFTHELPESIENAVRTDSIAQAQSWTMPTHPEITVIGSYANLYAFTRVELTSSPDSVQWMCQDESVANYYVPMQAPDAYAYCAPPAKYLPEPLHPYWPTQGPYVQ